MTEDPWAPAAQAKFGDRYQQASQPAAPPMPQPEQVGSLPQGAEYGHVPRPAMAERTFTITSLGKGWDVIEVAYEFQAPEQTISTEQRMVELHPTFAPRCR